MDIFRISIVGIAASLLAIQMKAWKESYRMYILLGACVVIAFGLLEKLRFFLDGIQQIRQYLTIDSLYLECILKMAGITCISEFAAGFCHDSGHEALAQQIATFAKLSILCFSMPIVLALLELVRDLLSF